MPHAVFIDRLLDREDVLQGGEGLILKGRSIRVGGTVLFETEPVVLYPGEPILHEGGEGLMDLGVIRLLRGIVGSVINHDHQDLLEMGDPREGAELNPRELLEIPLARGSVALGSVEIGDRVDHDDTDPVDEVVQLLQDLGLVLEGGRAHVDQVLQELGSIAHK